MSASRGTPWSDNPNAPQISHNLYFAEKACFAGFLISIIFYGIVIALFFQTMGALFNPMNRMKGATKWGPVAYTAAVFLFASMAVALESSLQLISQIDNREFPGVEGSLTGPLVYQAFVQSKAVSVVANLMLPLKQWLADGLLLYFCCVVYAMNYWVIALPCLMYIASIAMGISLIYETSLPDFTALQHNINLYFSISLMLHVLLTLMIVVRLVWHTRNIIRAGVPIGATRSYRTDVTVVIDSNTLYAIPYLLYTVSVASGSSVQYIFWQVISQIQAIAPFLIIRHFANRRALTDQTIAFGGIDSIVSNRRRKSTGDDEPFFYEIPPRSMETNGKAPGEPGIGDKTYADEAPRKALDSPTSRLGSAYPDSIAFGTQGEADR